MECIVLAGGLGTRLQGVIGAYPKCMAPVNGKPFLHYVFTYLVSQPCTRVILSLGFKHEIVTGWLDTQHWPFAIDHVTEQEPLGTGGGIQLAMRQSVGSDVAVLNGDTMFCASLESMLAFHEQKGAATTLALKEMQRFDRYGVVHTGDHGCITAFEEKRYCASGLINGGVYIINRQQFFEQAMPERFSFEKHYLEPFVQEGRFYGFEDKGYFIDIGIPEDYEKAQADFKALFK